MCITFIFLFIFFCIFVVFFCISFKSVKICLKISKTNLNKDIYKLSEIIPQYSKFAFFVMIFSFMKMCFVCFFQSSLAVFLLLGMIFRHLEMWLL